MRVLLILSALLGMAAAFQPRVLHSRLARTALQRAAGDDEAPSSMASHWTEAAEAKDATPSKLIQGVKGFGMAFKLEDWKHCIDTEECEVPEEVFGNPVIGAGSDGKKFDNLQELREIIELKQVDEAARKEA